MTHTSPLRATLSRALRHLLPAALALATATCTQDSVGPSDTGVGYFTFRPTYQLAGGASLAQFGIVADSIHIRLTRPVDQLVLDTTVFFPPDSTELRLALPIELQQSPDTLDAIIEMTAGGVVIFSDTVQAEVFDGPPNPANIPQVTFKYVGPGTDIRDLFVLPGDTTIFLGDTLFFSATAVDSSDADVTSFYVGWSTSDTSVAKINANGRLIAPNARGSVRVVGVTPTGIADSTMVTFAPTAVIVTADSGNAQSGQAGDSLPVLLVARVKAADSLGIAGRPVRFLAVTAGGAVRDTIVFTDSTGRAKTRGVLGLTAGTYSYTATAVGTGLPAATFTATATAGLATTIAIQGGNAQVDTVAQLLPLPLAVHVTDAFTNPVAGVPVVFFKVFGNGTVANDTVLTNASGNASIGYTLGVSIGTDSITATIAGTSAFAIFHVSGIADTPAQTQEFGGGNQTVAVNTAYPESLLVKVFDSHDNPVAGAKVVWSIFSGQGTLALDTTLTDSAGRATNLLTAGTLAGQLQVDVRALPIVNGITITNFVAAGAPTAIAITGGNAQVDTIGKTLPLPFAVHLTDAFANDVPGAKVYWTRTAGNGTLSSDSTLTDTAGATQVSYTLGGTVSADSITATIAGTSTFVTFSAGAISAAPTQIIQQLGGGQSATVAALFTDSLAVQILDLNDNPVGGVWVHWTDPTGAVTPSADSTLTDGNGHAAVTITAGTVAVATTVEASVAGIALPSVFNESVTAGAPSSMVIASGDGQVGASGSTLPLSPEVRITDVYSNPIAGLSVAFAVTAGGGTIDSATATTDSTGRANSGLWTLGAAGLNQVEATSATFPSDTLRFDATATPIGTSKLWTGATDNLWTTASNWSPAGVPTLTDNVFIPAGVTSPSLFSASNTHDLTIESGATLNTGSYVLNISGNLDVGGNIAGAGFPVMTGTGKTLRGSVSTYLEVAGGVALNGAFSTTGQMVISSGTLTGAGHTLVIGGTLGLSGSGQLVMGSVNDSVDVASDMTVNTSTSGTGDLTAGVLVLRGNFSQSGGAGTGFAPSGTHRTRFLGSTTQSVFFTNPGSAFSRFQDVEFGSPAGTTIGSTVTNMGVTTVSAGTVTGIGRTINLGGSLFTPYAAWQVSTTLWGQNPASYPDSLPRNVTVFNGWTLTKPFKTDSNLVINSTGILDLNGNLLRVGGSVTQTGILRMQNTGDTLDVKKGFTVNSSVTGAGELTAGMIRLHGGFAQTGGVVTTYQPSGSHITRFEGVTGQTATFTNPSLINSRFQNLELADSVNFTTGMAVQGTVTLLAGGKVTSNLSATLAGSLIDPTMLGWRYQTTVLSGIVGSLPDSLVTNLILQASWALTQRTKVTGTFTLSASGTLDLNGDTLAVTGAMTQAGIVTSVISSSLLDVGGNFTVNSGSSGVGMLSNGELRLHQSFTQTAGAGNNFAPSIGFVTAFAGTGGHNVSFATPGLGGSASHFNLLSVSDSITLLSNVAALDDVTLSAAGRVVGVGRTALIGADLVDPSFKGWRPASTVVSGTLADLPDSMTTDLVLQDTFNLVTPMVVAGDVTVDTTGVLSFVTGLQMHLSGDFTLSGRLSLQQAAHLLWVDGNFLVNSPFTNGGALYGRIYIGGDFQQATGAPDNFAPGGPLLTAFLGSGPHAISFATPQSSYFAELSISGASTVTLGSDVFAADTLHLSGTSFTTDGPQRLLRTQKLQVNGVTFDKVRVQVNSPASNSAAFDNVTFTNIDPTLTQLSLEFPGQVGDTIAFNTIVFSGTPTTGRYVYVADSAANDAVANIGFYNSTPLNGELFTGTEGSVGDVPNVLWSHLEWQVEPSVATVALPISPSPVVHAIDPSGVEIIGFTGAVTLQFSLDPTSGAASLSGNVENAVAGVATFDSLAISLAGAPFALTATAPGLGISAPTSSFTVDLPLPSGTTTAFNNGGGDNDWDNAANWTFGVPDSADNVFVFAGQTANVNTPARANTVTIGSGGTLLLNAPLTVDSSVTAGNTITGGGQLIAQGTGFLSGVVGGLIVTGNYLVPTNDTLTADFINISGSTAILDPGSARIVAVDSLRTEAGGHLDMNDVNAVVTVQGLARFTGGAPALLAGTLEIGGDFSQEENVGAFSPGPNFVTLFNGGGTQTATFFSPDTASDHFGVLGLTSGGTLHLAGAYVPILGNIDIQGGHVVVDTQAVVLGTITGATGAFMEGATLMIRGDFAFGGVYTVANTIFIGTNQTIQQGVSQFDTVYVQGSATLAGNVTANAFFVSGSGAQFDLGGRRLDVVGDFGTLQSGVFAMTDSADTVMVGGSFYAVGGSTDGLLTDGLLQVAGNFIEGNYVPCCVEVIQSGPSPAFDAFRASGNHLTRLAGGSGTRMIYFATPVSATDPFTANNSHFANLELTDGTDTLLSTVPAAGDLTVVTASLTHDPESNGGLGVQGDATIGAGVTLFDLSNLAISGSIDFQATPAVYSVGSTVFFGDGQTIPVLPYNDIEVVLGQATLGGDLSVGNVRTGISSEGPGFPGDLRLGGHALTVNGSFTTTGLGTFTMDDPADSLDVAGSMDLSGGVTTALTAGDLVLRGDLYMEDSNFVASGTHRTVFAAAGSQQLWITTAPDETGNQFNKLAIVAGTTVNFNAFSVGPLVVKDTFAINGFFLQANPGKSVIALGDLYAGVAAGITVDYVELHKSLDIDASSYSVQLTRYAGTGQVISATTAYNDLEVTGTGTTLDTTVTVNHDFAIHGGDFDPAGHTLAIAHDLLVDEDGLLKMSSAADSVNVGYTATFDGRDSEGSLTAGTLTFNYFKQLATTSPNAFRATGAHRAVLLQQNPDDETEMVQFATPGAAASQFQEFELSGGSLYAYFGAGTIYVADSLYVPVGGSSGLFGSGTTMTVNGPIAVQTGTIPIQFDTLELRGSIQVPYSSFSNNVTRFAGVNQQIPDTQSYQRIEVTGTATLETGGGLVAGASAEIYGSGRLTLGANMTFISTGTFATSGSGSVAMTDPSAALNIQGNADFLGGSTEGLLSSGTMTIQGDLNELGATSDSAFRPSVFGGFELQFDGDRRHSITMGTQFDVKSYLTKTVVTANDTLDVNDTPLPFFGRLDLLGNAALINSGGGQPFVEVLAPFAAAPGALVQLINLGFRDTVTVDPSATYDVGTTYFGYYALPVPVLPYQSIHFQGGTPFLGTNITATGWVTVNGQGSSADLRLNGLTLHAGNFETIQGGTLTMDQAADILTIDSTAHFRGGSEIGKLVAGGIVIGGDFKQDTAFGNSPSGFVPEGTTVDFTAGAVHNISFATTDSSWLPDITGTYSLNIVGRARVAGGVSVDAITGDTLITDGQLSSGPGGLSVTLKRYEGPVMYTFQAITDWTVGTTQFTGGGVLPYGNDFAFDTLIVSADVQGTLSQLVTANYVEVTGPGNPRHLGDTVGGLTLVGGDGNTTLNVNGDVVIRGAGAHITNSGGDLSATGGLTVDQDGYMRAEAGPWIFGGDVLIDGTITKDSLVQGSLSIGGNFTQLGTTVGSSFAPDSTFFTIFTGTGTHVIAFQTPSDRIGNGSYFGSLAVGDASGTQEIDFQGDYYVEGTLATSYSNGVTFHNTRPTLSRLRAQDVLLQQVTFDHVQFQLEKHGDPAAGTGTMDNISFTSFQNDEIQFNVILPGLSTGPFSWSNFTFTQLNPNGLDSGKYIFATDWDSQAPNLDISLGTSQSGDPPIYFQGGPGTSVIPFSP